MTLVPEDTEDGGALSTGGGFTRRDKKRGPTHAYPQVMETPTRCNSRLAIQSEGTQGGEPNVQSERVNESQHESEGLGGIEAQTATVVSGKDFRS